MSHINDWRTKLLGRILVLKMVILRLILHDEQSDRNTVCGHPLFLYHIFKVVAWYKASTRILTFYRALLPHANQT